MTEGDAPNLTPEARMAHVESLSQKNPLKIFKMMEDARRNDKIPDFLIGVEALSRTAAINTPSVAGHLRRLGDVEKIWMGAYKRLQIVDQRGNQQEVTGAVRVAELLGLEEVAEAADKLSALKQKYGLVAPAAAPEPEDPELARLREEAKGLAEQAVQRGVTPREVYERFVPAADLSMLSLSQLKERAASLTSEQLSQIPPYKLSIMIENGLLTVRQVASLPKDQIANEAIEYYAENMAIFRDAIEAGNIVNIRNLPKMTLAALRAAYMAEAQRLPNDVEDKIYPETVLQGLNRLERQWQDYKKRTGKFLVGGLARIKTSAPVLSQDQIARIRRMVSIGEETRQAYERETTAYGLSRMEDYLANTGNLALQPDELESLEKNLAKDPGTFPLLAKYVRDLREAEAASRREAPSPDKDPFDTVKQFSFETAGMETKIPIFLVRYTPDSPDRPFNQPNGLGRWNFYQGATSVFPEKPNKWLIQPKPGQLLILKSAGRDASRFTNIQGEREALLHALSVFPEDAPNRPVRIMGFGATTGASVVPYIIEEYIDPEKGFIEVEELAKKDQNKSMAAKIGLGVLDIYRKLHRAGVTHPDLHWNNIFFNGKEVRLIDFEGSRTAANGERISYAEDRMHLGHFLFKLATGDGLAGNVKQIQEKIQAQGDKLGSLKDIIERASLAQYGDIFSHEGTETMYQELQQALEKIVREGNEGA